MNKYVIVKNRNEELMSCATLEEAMEKLHKLNEMCFDAIFLEVAEIKDNEIIYHDVNDDYWGNVNVQSI